MPSKLSPDYYWVLEYDTWMYFSDLFLKGTIMKYKSILFSAWLLQSWVGPFITLLQATLFLAAGLRPFARTSST